MGDLIQTTPLISGLRDKYPDARITLMVSSDFVDAVTLIPDIDDSVVFNLRQFKDSEQWDDESWVKIYRYIESELNEIRNESYDLLVNLSHSRLSALMVYYLKVKNVIGFHCNGSGDRITGHPWMQYFGTEPFNRSFNEFNLVEMFTRSAGVDLKDREIQISQKFIERDVNELFDARVQKTKNELVIGFQIGSSLENRRWSTKSFAELADLLIEKLNARILLFGVASESKSAADMISLVKEKSRVVDLTGKTDIPQLTELLSDCDYLVTNDTGTMHLAAALKTKIIGLFFAHAHPFETAPFSSGHLIFQARISCAPCSYGVHCNNIVCVDKVLPEHIFNFVEGHLELGRWEVPSELKNADELNIFETILSSQGIVSLRPMLKRDLSLNDLFRLAYAVLWRETLDVEIKTDLKVVQENLGNFSISDYDNLLDSLSVKIKFLKEIEALGTEGVRLCEGIVKNASGIRALPEKLVKFGEGIDSIDEKIELIGMTHPELKPITDLFCKRKENLIGSDISRLGIESRECYSLLQKESRRMIEVLLVHEEQLNVCLVYKTHNSISV